MDTKKKTVFKLNLSAKYFEFYLDEKGILYKYQGKIGKHVKLLNFDKTHKEFNLEVRVLLNTFRMKYKPYKLDGNSS